MVSSFEVEEDGKRDLLVEKGVDDSMLDDEGES
jgi:hypothetical protein